MGGKSGRAVIYVRQSKARNDSISEEIQLEACRAHCERTGLRVVTEVTEIGVSGYGSWEKRPKFPAMLKGLQIGSADVLVIYRWSRLSRNARDALNLWNTIEAAGVRIEAAAENMDTGSAAGALSAKQMLIFAEYESRQKGEQFKEAHARRVSMGLPRDGHKRFGYDYKSGRHEINVTEADTIRIGFSAFMAGNSLMAVVDQLNEGGRRTAAGKKFAVNSFFRVLDSGFPFGVLLLDRGTREASGAHEPILTADDWSEYKAERKRRAGARRVRPTRDMWELAGIATCGYCGSALTFINREREYLRCSVRNGSRTRCEGVRVKGREVWAAFHAAMGESDSASYDLVRQSVLEATADLDDVYKAAKHDRNKAKREVESVEEELGRLATGWASGVLNDVGYRKASESASDRLKAAESVLEAAEDRVLASRPPEGMERLEAMLDWNAAETNALWRRALPNLAFFKDHVIATRTVGGPMTIQREAPKHKYPLSEWLDGQEHVLRQGVDFKPPIKSMRQTLTAAAKRRGMTVRVTTVEEGVLRLAPAKVLGLGSEVS